jgi:lipoprotein-anchoring transpeptidase ErfK/SrfK
LTLFKPRQPGVAPSSGLGRRAGLWLNQPVPRGKQYKLPASTGRDSGFLYWVLVLLLIAGMVWVWQRTRRDVPPQTPIRQQSSRPTRPPWAVPAPPAVARPTTRPQAVAQTIVPIASGALPREPQDTFEAQLVLARIGISPGSLDGVMGSQTRAALLAFQQRERLPQTGGLDNDTRRRLRLETHPIVSYWVSSNDLARLQPIAPSWLGKSQQSALDYESILELVAEKSHANPKLIRSLNPSVNWSNVTAGTELRVPDAACAEPAELAAFVRISLSGKTLEAFGAQSNLLAHFPCSIAQRVEKRPVGELHVAAIAPDPNYTFNPEVFPESPEAQAVGRKLVIPPGPNNPVGVAWISLDRPGYGIHGTPGPEQVGRTESHGCFRLANWNAEYFLKLVSPGTPVFIEP